MVLLDNLFVCVDLHLITINSCMHCIWNQSVDYSKFDDNFFTFNAEFTQYKCWVQTKSHFVQDFNVLNPQARQKGGLLPICQHPISSSIKCYDSCVSAAFRDVMQSLSDLLPRLPAGSHIQKVRNFECFQLSE